MNFTLRERTPKEIEDKKNENSFYASMVKGIPLPVCSYEVTLANGEKRDVWDLTEKEILSLVASNCKEGLKDRQRLLWTHKIIEVWQEKHNKISVDMIEGFFKLREKYPEQKSHIADFQGSMGADDIAFARRAAAYMRGIHQDEVTDDSIVTILKNEEKIKKAENKKGKTV